MWAGRLLGVQSVADLVQKFSWVEPHGGILAVPALLAFGVDEHEAVARQSGVVTPLSSMSWRICARVFITIGRTVTLALASSAALFSISPICTMQDWHPAPSLKYSTPFSPPWPSTAADFHAASSPAEVTLAASSLLALP